MITVSSGNYKCGNKWQGSCKHCGCKVEANDNDIQGLHYERVTNPGFVCREPEAPKPYVYCPSCENILFLVRIKRPEPESPHKAPNPVGA